jgi:2,3-dihydroxybiphenyl 1,2-dioxygenase
MIKALSYIGIKSSLSDEWAAFATKILGMQLIDKGGDTSIFRMDNQAQRLFVSEEHDESIACIGWEVETKASLGAFGSHLESNGVEVFHGSQSLASQRQVADLLWFIDPAGFRVELVWKPEETTEQFVPGRPIEGFKTGPLGMGHAVLYVANIDEMVIFYRDVLGFQLSDYGKNPIPLYFFHVNERHHSLAFVGSKTSGFHHFMIEYQHLDDVGQGYDLAETGLADIAYTIGRHTNDHMISYYAHTPSGFFVESGWGGRIIDPKTWVPHEIMLGPSFWGHERLYLPENERSTFRDKRLKIAEDGQRAPLLADRPWLFKKRD